MAVAFDALGGGKAADTNSSNPNNFTWSHTASGTDSAVLVFVAVSLNGATSSITRSATYGGVSMTELGAGSASTSGVPTGNGLGHLIVFGLINPAIGAQTVAVNLSGVATGSSGNSQSYTGVDSFGTVSAANGVASGTAMSHPVTGSAAGRLIAQSFIATNTTGTSIGSYNQTSRFNIVRGSFSPAIVGGDAAGSASTVTFSGTRTSAVAWKSYAVDLVEAVAPAGNTGAFFALF